jgi:hypothetical protein
VRFNLTGLKAGLLVDADFEIVGSGGVRHVRDGVPDPAEVVIGRRVRRHRPEARGRIAVLHVEWTVLRLIAEVERLHGQ